MGIKFLGCQTVLVKGLCYDKAALGGLYCVETVLYYDLGCLFGRNSSGEVFGSSLKFVTIGDIYLLNSHNSTFGETCDSHSLTVF